MANKPPTMQLQKPETWPSPDFNPVGYPCETSSEPYPGDWTWKDSNGKSIKTMKTKANARGVVRALNTKKNFVYVHLSREDSLIDKVNGDIGWLPGNWIIIGTSRKFGQKQTLFHGLDAARLDQSIVFDNNLASMSPCDTVLAQTFSAISRLRGQFTFIPEGNWDTLSKYGPAGLAKQITEGIARAAPGYLNLLNDSTRHHSYNQVFAQGREFISGDEGQTVIYTRRYRNFKNNPNKAAANYWGKTYRGKKREDEHTENLDDITGHQMWHYKYARGAQDAAGRVMCVLKDADVQAWAEQAFILLNDSYAPYLKKSTSTEINLDTITADEVESTDTDQEDSQRHGTADRMVQAVLLRKVFQIAKAVTSSFKGAASGAAFGALGLNTESPSSRFGNQRSRDLFTLIHNPGGSRIFRKIPKPAITKERSSNAFFKIGIAGSTLGGEGGKNLFIIELGADTKPPVGARFSVVVEIMDNDQQHEVPYARSATVGMYRNHEKANSLGLRVEWNDGSETKSMAIQSGVHFGIQPTGTSASDRKASGDAGVGASHGYVIADALRRFLEQERVTNLPSWAQDFGIARILDVRFEHLSQTTILTERTPPKPITLDRSFKLSSDEIKQKYVAKGFALERIGASYKVLNIRKGARRRKPCDRCYLLRGKRRSYNTAITEKDCEKKDNEESCIHCLVLGLPCTFTDTPILEASQQMQDAVSYLLPATPTTKGSRGAGRRVIVVPDPRLEGLHTLQEEEADD